MTKEGASTSSRPANAKPKAGGKVDSTGTVHPKLAGKNLVTETCTINGGNTCYQNSILRSLAATDGLIDKLRSLQDNNLSEQ